MKFYPSSFYLLFLRSEFFSVGVLCSDSANCRDRMKCRSTSVLFIKFQWCFIYINNLTRGFQYKCPHARVFLFSSQSGRVDPKCWRYYVNRKGVSCWGTGMWSSSWYRNETFSSLPLHKMPKYQHHHYPIGIFRRLQDFNPFCRC
jgi:hypothetical protein